MEFSIWTEQFSLGQHREALNDRLLVVLLGDGTRPSNE
jgi:hypothetical protein